MNRQFAFVLFSLVFLFGLSFAWNNLGGGVCECENCTDCVSALNDAVSCTSEVRLNTSTTFNGTCINDPPGFASKAFNCLGNSIKGNGSGMGIYLQGNDYAPVKNCIISGFDRGIYFNNQADYNTVLNTTVFNNSWGIYLYDNCRYYNITNSTAYNNTNEGIYINRYSSYNVLDNVECHSNGGDGLEIWMWSQHNNVSNSKFYNNSERGIDLFNAARQNTFDNVSVYDNGNYGVELGHQGADSNNIYNSQIFNNSNHGVRLIQSLSNDFINVTSFNNSGYGFSVEGMGGAGSTNNYFFNVTAHNNTGNGFAVSGSSSNTFANCTSYFNGYSGFYAFLVAPGASFYNCTSHNNGQNGFGFYWTANNPRLENCEAHSNGGSGLSMTHLMSLGTVNNSRFHNNSGSGLQLSARQVDVYNSYIFNNSEGVTCTNADCEQNEFFNTTICNNSGRGIYLASSSRFNTFTNSTICNNSGAGVYMASNSHHHKFYNNTIYDNADYGIYSTSGQGSIYENNEIFNNSDYGILYWHGSYDSIINNTVYDHTEASIRIAHTHHFVVSNNTLHSSKEGLYLDDLFSSTVEANRIYNHSTRGVYLRDFDSGDFNDNEIYNNSYGIDGYWYTNQNNFINNTIYDNSGDALYCENHCYENRILDNKIYNNTGHGIYLYDDGYDSVISNNKVYNNSGHAFYVSFYSHRVNLTNNTAYNNAGFGFCINTSDDNNLTNNTAYNNSYALAVAAPTVPFDVFVNNMLFLNPLGTLLNYTNLSLEDNIQGGDTYLLKWIPEPAAPPDQAISFAQKYVEITPTSGSPNIDTVIWHWNTGELGGYDENKFNAVRYSGGAWAYVDNQARNAAQNRITVSNLDTFSNFGILEFGSNISTIKTDVTALPPSPGGIVEFQIVVTNTGNLTFDPISVVDTLPAGFSYSSTNTTPVTVVGQLVNWTVGPLPPTNSLTILLNATVDSGTPSGIYTNWVDVEGVPSLGDNVTDSDSVNVGVNASAINVVKTASTYSPGVGQQVTFILNISNTGEVNLTFSALDTLPAGLQFNEAAPPNTSSAGQIIYWDTIFENVTPGDFRIIEYNVTVLSAGALENEANVTGVPPNGDNVTDTDSVILSASSPSNGHDPEEPECEDDEDCPDCYYCSIATGKCKLKAESQCGEYHPCPQVLIEGPMGGEPTIINYMCIGCQCVKVACLEDVDCKDECLVCSAEGECVFRIDCATDSDCPEGYDCTNCACTKKEKEEEPEEEPQEVPEELPEEVPEEEEEPPFSEPSEISEEVVPLIEVAEEGEEARDELWETIITGVWILLFLLILVAIIYVLSTKKKKRRPKA